MAIDAGKYAQNRFPGQKPGEQIMVLVRKHWMIDVKVALIFLVLGIFPLALVIVAAIYFWDGTFNDMFLLITLGVWVYLLAIMAFTYMAWLNEELDIIIVTNERVVAHDQIDLFHRQISETNIAQIQDVKGVEKGVWGNMLHYGTIEIQTAARAIIFTIKHANRPYQKARDILDIRDKYMDKEKFESPPEEPSPVFNL